MPQTAKIIQKLAIEAVKNCRFAHRRGQRMGDATRFSTKTRMIRLEINTANIRVSKPSDAWVKSSIKIIKLATAILTVIWQ